MSTPADKCAVDVVLFDFGGVLAEEGFEKGLRAIAVKHGLNETEFFNLAHELIHTTGYITGRADEHAYWEAIRDRTGIGDDDGTLRRELLSRFILRSWMFDIVRELKASGIRVVILSDQTNWLDELNGLYDFFKYFDVVFNSYHVGKNKMDVSHFSDTISRLKGSGGRMLFIDDSEAHCERARKAGMKAIRYTGRESFLKDLEAACPGEWLQDLSSQ
ncbi:MAG TPA: HAD family phosphatase [Deltaproteobacteria bacterium]|nr:HAD family phosphatase [Deltaproteobacteria bacterium]